MSGVLKKTKLPEISNGKSQFGLVLNPRHFNDWSGLLKLLRSEFAYTQGLVFPPSTVFNTSKGDLRRRAQTENLILGFTQDQLVASLFFANHHDRMFLGRFAISQPYRGNGLARRMLSIVEETAKVNGLSVLELETRVNLKVNQAKFTALGFRICGGRAHRGYDHKTTLIMKKFLR